MSTKNFSIIKSYGSKEPYSRKKLLNSLHRSGLKNNNCESILNKVEGQITENSRTQDIFKKTLRLIEKNSPLAAVNYSLKKALLELGPGGHNFESFVEKYFEHKGYETKKCVIVKGSFVKHEVDVIAIKNKKKYFVECKFHNRIGLKNDIKTALYVKARWDDLKQGENGNDLDGFYLVTNTAFSLDAITYAKGTGLKLLGVNAPAEKSFFEEIKELHLYPVTSLKSINKLIKSKLLQHDIILAQDLTKKIHVLYELGISSSQVEKILSEIKTLQVS